MKKILYLLFIYIFICTPSYAKRLDEMNSNTSPDITNDLIYSQDVSDTSENSHGTGKSLTIKNLLKAGKITVDGTNVGINSINPTQQLDVVGTVKATAFIGDGSGLTGVSGTASDAAYSSSWNGDTTGIASKNAIYDKIETITSGGISNVVEDTTPQLGGNLDLNGSGIVFPSTTITDVLDEDTMSSDSATKAATQQSIKAYVDTAISGVSSGSGGWTDGGTNISLTTSTDNVGVGTTLPRGKLDVIGTLYIGHNASGQFTSTSGMGFDINNDASNDVVISSGGNLGIGTTGPTQKLQIVGTVSATAFAGDGSGLTGLPSGGGWTDGGSNIYTTDTTDNVGIGTTTPTTGFKLDVRGNQYVSGLVGIGTVSPASAFEVVQSTFANSGMFTRTTAATTGTLSAGRLNARSSGSTTDGFGPLFAFTLEDTTNVNSALGYIGAVRAGADTTGDIVLSPAISASPTERLRVMSGGNVGIGTSKPLALMAVGTAIPVASYTNVGSGDVYIQNDLEVDGTVYMESCSGAGCGGANGWTDGGASITTTTTTDTVGIGTTTVADGILQIGGDNVAIGIGGTNNNATAAGELYVKGDLEVDGTIYGDGSQLTGIAAGGWVDGGTNVYVSPTTDNVGIGTTTPSTNFKADVRGNLYVSGNVGIGTLLPRGTLDLGPTGTVYAQTITGPTGPTILGTSNNVGIGTITAGSLLTVGSTGQAAITSAGVATLPTPILTGKIDINNVAVNDDDCTGEQGLLWYDSTDSAFEFCKNNSGTPERLGQPSPPASQTITAGATITADACGTFKDISSAGAVTTDTTNTFTAPSSDLSGCCMNVVNTGANNITLDNNSLFYSAGAADVVLGLADSAIVCTNGTVWAQMGGSNN